jgi:hypothetical protein
LTPSKILASVSPFSSSNRAVMFLICFYMKQCWLLILKPSYILTSLPSAKCAGQVCWPSLPAKSAGQVSRPSQPAKSAGQIGVPNRGPKSGSQIWVPNRGPKTGSQVGVPSRGPKSGSQIGVPNRGQGNLRIPRTPRIPRTSSKSLTVTNPYFTLFSF